MAVLFIRERCSFSRLRVGLIIVFYVAFLDIHEDKEISGIINKVKECKYFEKQEDEVVKEEKETEDEQETSEPIKSTAEEAVVETDDAFTSDVRGAEVYQEVPSDHVPVRISCD